MRELDLVLFGVTGYTGRLVAAELGRRVAGGGLRVGLAGRDRAKLDAVRNELSRELPAIGAWPLLIADTADQASLRALAASTRVLCTTVGPYSKYGAGVVAACVEAGTDYCDLTGESPFVRAMMEAHHARAGETGARIVCCAGFDSVPSDLGVLMVQDHATRTGGSCAAVTSYFCEMRGGASGGTVASMLNIIESIKRDRSVLKVLGHPYSLDPEPRPRGPDGSDEKGVGRAPELGQYTAPFVMAAINARVVRRSHALLGRPWGSEFRYREVMATGDGLGGLSRALQMTALLPAGLLGLSLPVVGSWLKGKLPAPGEGPTPEERERGYFVVRLLGERADGRKVYGRVSDSQDPGYGSTSRMLAQVALSLAQDELPRRGGVLTPASALGMRLVERLRAIGMRWEVAETPSVVWARGR